MWKQPHHLHILAGILLLYVLVIALPAQALGAANVAVLAGVLVMIVHGRRQHRRWDLVVVLVAAVMCTITITAAVVASRNLRTLISEPIVAIMGVAAIWLLGDTVRRRASVDRYAISAVLGIYLLLALIFASVHEVLAAVEPHYLSGTSSPPTASDALYFSVITMTTVGFGDIAPATNVARAVASVEALVGQLFLVSVVAVVVAQYRTKRERDRG